MDSKYASENGEISDNKFWLMRLIITRPYPIS